MSWIAKDRKLTLAERENNADIIIPFYRDLGYADETIASILGNMDLESTLSPIINEYDGEGYGLVQWTPYTKYTNWIVNQGFSDPSEMDANIFRILYEVSNNLQWIATSAYNYSFEDLSKALNQMA